MVAAVVAVVVVVGAGCFVLFGNGNDSGSSADIASKLQIRGNANDDHTINSDDMAIVQDIINGTRNKDDFPLADVNDDGKVNETDVSLLQDLIDRKEGCTVYVICLDRDGKNTSVSCTYPLRNVVPYGTNVQEPVLYANGGQYVAGYFVSSYDVADASIAKTAVNLHGTTRTISATAWSNFTKLDSDLISKGGVGALIVDYSGIAQITAARADDCAKAGIPMLIFSSADATDETTTVLTLGFLFGGDCEKLGVKYAQIAWDVIEFVKSKVGGYTNEQKVTYICCTMYIYLCGKTSTFNTTATTAGGYAYANVNADFDAATPKNSQKMGGTEAMANYTTVGKVINNRSMDFGLDADGIKAMIIDTWDHDNDGVSSKVYFKGYDDKLVYVNNLLPGGAKIAYMAHAMYPDLFSKSWADDVLKDYINTGTMPLKGQTLSSICSYIDVNDYKAAIA